jgi:anti-sigma28 factor (negative regulator of flagellin synthesis)
VSIEPTSGNLRPVEPAGAPSRASQQAKPQGGSRSAGGGEGQDAIELSAGGREVVRLDESDVAARARLIAELRRQVDAGTYKPDADQIARRLAEKGGM